MIRHGGIVLILLLAGCATTPSEPEEVAAERPAQTDTGPSEITDPLATAEVWLTNGAESDEVSRKVMPTMREPEIIRIYKTSAGYNALVADGAGDQTSALKLSMVLSEGAWTINDISRVESTLLWPTFELQNE